MLIVNMKASADVVSTMNDEDREWLIKLQEQANANSEAITAFGATLTHIRENFALTTVLLSATGSLCAEIAIGADNPYERLEEVIATFESGLQQAISQEAFRPDTGRRLLEQMDVLREIAERTMVARLGDD